MRIAIGSDHAGFLLKEHLKEVLKDGGHEVIDLGTDSEEPVDYPPICAGVGKEVAAGRAERGIVLGGSGQGEQISANKVRGVRAALCNDLYTAEYSRRHNDANVLSIGARASWPRVSPTRSSGLARHRVRRRPSPAPHRRDHRTRVRVTADRRRSELPSARGDRSERSERRPLASERTAASRVSRLAESELRVVGRVSRSSAASRRASRSC